jgi:cytoskeletal protein CcmA (bactofilin family)
VDAGITTTGGGDVALTVGPTGSIRLGAPLASATGDLVITGDVTLTADVQMTTGGGTIRVDGTIDGNRLLDLHAGSGTIDLLDSIGGMTPLLGLTAAAASVRFAGAQARVNDPVSNGFIRILGDLLLANDVTLTSDGVILLDGDVTSETSPRRLTLSAGETVTTTGDVTVKSVVVDAVGDVDFEGAVTASEYVRIRSDSAVTFDQSIRADELRIVAAGDVAIVGDVNANSSTTLQSLTDRCG